MLPQTVVLGVEGFLRPLAGPHPRLSVDRDPLPRTLPVVGYAPKRLVGLFARLCGYLEILEHHLAGLLPRTKLPQPHRSTLAGMRPRQRPHRGTVQVDLLSRCSVGSR